MESTSKKNSPGTAFVAMKFTGNTWRDRRYQAIVEVLEEVGFNVVRADQIRSSGEVVREVLNHLRTADLVVLDSSGDSHSVSYELGYCHGISRSPNTLVLLRQEGTPIPFNFAHFRHLLYRDLKHLRRLLRDRLDLSTPLLPDQLGYAFSFDVEAGAGSFGESVANAIAASLRKIAFTGRCEYYAGDLFPGSYVVGLGLKQSGSRNKISHEWWSRFAGKVGLALAATTDKVRLNKPNSELGELRSFRNSLLNRGVIELEHGHLSRNLNPDENGLDSWFLTAVARDPETPLTHQHINATEQN